MTRRQIELGDNLALLGSLAHQFRAPAPAQHEPKRIQQDGLTCTGLASQNVQTRLKAQLQMVDNQKVANIKRAQLGPALTFVPRPQPQSHCPLTD